mmetsp:Transcript_34581/g.91882  ORF Transcript_34581/g.91882 Transcript_34581/m.91882 type:complete len:368 (+) Transcript_34581:58-1161(+)
MVVLKPASPMNNAEYAASLCLLIALTVSTVVLGAVRGYHFSTTYSQYVNQATALVYGVVSSFHLWALAKWDRWDHWRLAHETVDEYNVTTGDHGGDRDGDVDGGGGSGGSGRDAKCNGRAGSNSEALLNGHERYDDSGGVPDSPVDGPYVGPGALRVTEEDNAENRGSDVTDMGRRTSFGRHSSCEAPPTMPVRTNSDSNPGGPYLNAISERGSLTSPLTGKGKAAVPGDDFVLRKAPIYILVAIGWLNGTGNFCAMIGQPHTRGETQSLIMIAGIPAVLALSWIILGKRPNAAAGVGALVIVCASLVSALPSIMSPEDDDIDSYWYSVTIYFAAQIFWSLEKVRLGCVRVFARSTSMWQPRPPPSR